MFMYMNTSVSQLIASVRVHTYLHKTSKQQQPQHIAFGMAKWLTEWESKKGTRMFGEYPNHPRKISNVSGKTFKFYVTKQDFAHKHTLSPYHPQRIHTIFRIT